LSWGGGDACLAGIDVQLLHRDGGLLIPVVELDLPVEFVVPVPLVRLGTRDLLPLIRSDEVAEDVHRVREHVPDLVPVGQVDLDLEVGIGVAVHQYRQVPVGGDLAALVPLRGEVIQSPEGEVVDLADQFLDSEVDLDHLAGVGVDERGRGDCSLALGEHGRRDGGHGVSLGRCFRLNRTLIIY
jgi:hypothetical protein